MMNWTVAIGIFLIIKMVIIIDNYDSFTYNLVHYFWDLGAEVTVFFNDDIDIIGIKRLKPDHIIISPGPGMPTDAGVSNEVIYQLGPEIPLLGVCLGHQCIGHVFGGKVCQAENLMHGKISPIYHNDDSLFSGIPNPFEAMRYHSLVVSKLLPDCLQVIANTKQNEIMGLKHKVYPIYGVQFHPESILTQDGKKLLGNFLAMTH